MKNTLLCTFLLVFPNLSCVKVAGPDIWEKENPIHSLPPIPLGLDMKFTDLKVPPTRQSVRLGRWLFFDKRLSKDGTISCATFHIPTHGFSEALDGEGYLDEELNSFPQ